MGIKASAPGKIILSGEHSVVYGYPALAAAVNLRLTVFGTGKIESEIPVGAGMGSSAAYAVAKSALIVRKPDLKKINELAYKMEKKQHGNPSGVDNTVATYGGFLWFRRETENFKTFKQIECRTKLPKLFLLNSGKPTEPTKEMVKYVAGIYTSKKDRIESIFREIENVTREFLRYIVNESKEGFGKLIYENEKLLEKLGVVSDSARRLIRNIEKTGGFAKISGAGGKKNGSGMILVHFDDIEKISLFGKENNLNLLPVKLGEDGVKIE